MEASVCYTRAGMAPESCRWLAHKTFEVLAVYLHGASLNLLVVVIFYRSSSIAISSTFFDEFDDALERSATFSSAIPIVGDINIHLDVVNDPNTFKFMQLLDDHDLVQHVVGSEHRDGHTLDVLITRSNARAPALVIEELKLFGFDHSFITDMLDLQHDDDKPVAKTIERRRWRDLNQDSFTNDLLRLKLIVDPPSDAMSLFKCYHQMLKSLVNKHSPLAKIIIRSWPTAPWYDAGCVNVKATPGGSSDSIIRAIRQLRWTLGEAS